MYKILPKAKQRLTEKASHLSGILLLSLDVCEDAGGKTNKGAGQLNSGKESAGGVIKIKNKTKNKPKNETKGKTKNKGKKTWKQQ
jgi:hypothetical protein